MCLGIGSNAERPDTRRTDKDRCLIEGARAEGSRGQRSGGTQNEERGGVVTGGAGPTKMVHEKERSSPARCVPPSFRRLGDPLYLWGGAHPQRARRADQGGRGSRLP